MPDSLTAGCLVQAPPFECLVLCNAQERSREEGNAWLRVPMTPTCGVGQ